MTSRAESCPPKLVTNHATVGKQNAALQGATLAFSARLANGDSSTRAQHTSHSAAAAAAAAGTAGTRSSVKSASASRPIKPQDVHQPIPIKSPSQSAALVASARASPKKDTALQKTSSEPITRYAFGKSPGAVGDPTPKQKAKVDEDHGRGGSWLDNTIVIPQPVRPLPTSAHLTAILGLEPEISSENTPHSASPPPATSADMNSALVAAKLATLATQLSDHSSNALADSSGKSLGSTDSVSAAKDGFQHSFEVRTSLPASSMHSPPTQIGTTQSLTMQTTNTSDGHGSESAASSAMRCTTSASEVTDNSFGRVSESAASSVRNRTTSFNESLQSAPRSPQKHVIAPDALIAWSIASSRAASPTKGLLPPSSRRRSRSFGMFHHHHKPSEHESSKPHVPILKPTLRKHHQADEDDQDNRIVKRGRHHLIRKHQHKHHEGDRKRWRDRVTDRERKRYEGVWAANRGLYTFWDFSTTTFERPSRPPAEMDEVLNIVVREVWERSRLPRSELEEVWDLVARENAKTLRRDEFVVGLWLLDQRLKGRKLPTRVSPSVWASVRHSLNIRTKP